MQAEQHDHQQEANTSGGKSRFWQRIKKKKSSSIHSCSISEFSISKRYNTYWHFRTRNDGRDQMLTKNPGSPARTVDSKSTTQTREAFRHFTTFFKREQEESISSSSISSSLSKKSSQSSDEDNSKEEDITNTIGFLDLARAISMKRENLRFAEENIRCLGDDLSSHEDCESSEGRYDQVQYQGDHINTIDDSVNFTFRTAEEEVTAAVFSELEVEPKVTKAPGFEHQDEDGDDIERKHKAVRSEQCLKDIPTNRKKRSIFFSRRKAKTEGKTERMGTIGGRKLVPIGKMKVFSNRNRVQSKGSITEMPQRLSVMELMGLNDIDSSG